MNKLDLLHKIKALQGLSNDEKAVLINLVNTNKKYGLVWEDKPEDVEEELLTKLPVFIEDKEKFIEAKPPKQKKELFDGETVKAPNHILIEGDNLHALTALSFTHEGKVDVMYFDPPYNTGNKDFKYNDHFVDKEDSYRHSKWLSFMNKRLRLAKRLLKDTGVLFISIDDNELAQLKLLCEENSLFGEENFISDVAVINNFKGRSDDKYIATAHEHLLIFKKKSFTTLGVPVPDEYVDEYTLQDDRGRYRLQGLRKRGSGSKREDRPNMYYPIFYNKDSNKISLTRELKTDIEILPKLSDGSDGRWRWGKDTVAERLDELVVTFVRKRNEYDLSQKDYLHEEHGELKRIKPKSFWMGSEFSSDAGTKALKEIIHDVNFNNPKSVDLIKYCLEQSAKKEAVILDIFAGSGTTLHAVMEINSEDDGNRQCILVTNDENNIAEEVCYERNKRVIKGYKKPNGEKIEGLLNNNLRYFTTAFVGREKTTKNKKELTQLATALLCIKEDCYTEVKTEKNIRLFEEGDKRLIVVHDDIAISKAIELISQFPEGSTAKVYVFSEGQDPYTEDFLEVADKVELCALPDAIYKAYLHVLPKKSRKGIPHIEEVIPVVENGNGQLKLETSN
jgi:adenine-specific DNA-methyltransferase